MSNAKNAKKANTNACTNCTCGRKKGACDCKERNCQCGSVQSKARQ